MSTENATGQDAPVVDNAATPPVTAPANTETPASETQTEVQDENETAEPKTFTQEELNAIVQKEKAKADAKAERRVLRSLEKLVPQQQHVQQQHQQVDDKPQREQFASDEEYIDKLTDWKLDKRESAGRQQKAQEQSRSLVQKTESIYAEAAKVPGFDREDFDALPLTQTIAQALTESDVAPKLMAYMSSNPEEVERIAKLSPARQGVEMGKIEAKLAVAKAPSVSKAPEPIAPLGSKGGIVKSLANASVDDVAAMMKKNGSRWVR